MNQESQETIDMFETLCTLAKIKDVKITENTIKIARLRALRNIPIEVCPCARDDKERGCISAKCLKEINENGICHCNCFKKKGEKQNDSKRINKKASTNA